MTEGHRGPLPRIFNPEFRADFKAKVETGSYISEACKATGLATPTYYEWRRRAKHNVEPYASFFNELEAIEAAVEVQVVDNIVTQSKKDWRAGIEYLRRKAPARWNRTLVPIDIAQAERLEDIGEMLRDEDATKRAATMLEDMELGRPQADSKGNTSRSRQDRVRRVVEAGQALSSSQPGTPGGGSGADDTPDDLDAAPAWEE